MSRDAAGGKLKVCSNFRMLSDYASLFLRSTPPTAFREEKMEFFLLAAGYEI
jgi:hypothetical protein